MPYRIEISANNRAGCQAPPCKNEQKKILKGELRQGVLVTIQEHQSMKWRHWGCVTPTVLNNWKEESTGDMELVDGYDELPEDAQDKVRRAFDQGHVDDEDWNGDLEMNRFDPAHPKRGGMFVKTPKKEKKAKDEDGDQSPSEKKQPKKRSRKSADMDDEADTPSTPVAKKSRSKKGVKTEDADEAAPAPAVKKSKGKKSKAEIKTEATDGADEPAQDSKPGTKKQTAKKASKKESIPKQKDADSAKPQKRKSKAKKAANE